MALEIRPARPEDQDAVGAFCSTIWAGQDYVPRLWEEWLHDPQGLLLVATWEEVPVAVARAAFYSPGEAWMEGMRVDPEYRRQGISGALSGALLEACRQRGARVARLMTMWNNTPVHRICQHLGLELVLKTRQRFRPLETGSMPPAVRTLEPEEAALAQGLLVRRRSASFLEATGGLYSLGGGVWTSWNEERLREHLERGQVWVWPPGGRAEAIAVVNPHRRRPGVYEVGLLEGPARACRGLLEGLVRHGEIPDSEDEDRPPMVRMAVPMNLPRLHRALASAGYYFHRRWRGELWVLERWL